MPNDICFVIFFNHRYEKNIPKLYRYYGERFENIRIIIPFFRTYEDSRIIRVYENSYNFQGFIAQAYNEIRSSRFSHYIFIGDDCILNSRVNQENIVELLRLQGHSSFITDLEPIAGRSLSWSHFSKEKIGFRTLGVEYLNEIPDFSTALKTIKSHDQFAFIPDKDFTDYQSINDALMWSIDIYKRFHTHFLRKKIRVPLKYFPKTTKKLPFPLLKGYSDFFTVAGEAFDDFAHYCGIFSSMRMFAEIAIPTALALTSRRLVGLKDTDFQSKEYWGDARLSELEKLKKETRGNINNLFLGDRQRMLWYHPIKLSSWDVK